MELNMKPVVVSGDELNALAERSGRMLKKIRDSMLQPFPRKQSPTFTSGKLQSICGIDKTRMNYLLGKDFPQGFQSGKGRQRTFTLEESIAWVKGTIGKDRQRPQGQLGKVIAVANFKGGVTKTTTSMILAQGLALRHARKVLIIDLDPQGSTTTFFGINPHAEVEADQTVLPLIDNSQPDLTFAPMQTYWTGVDLIPSSTDLFNAEFILPAKVHSEDPSFQFWNVLRNGLIPLLPMYDYVIIDSAPTLSYLTINALFAADSIIVPVVPDTLSFASMVQFWTLFSDLVNGLKDISKGPKQKVFDYIDILITRMPAKSSAQMVRDWIIKTYGDHVLPVEIPETSLAMTTSAEFATVYDMPNYQGSTNAYERICEPYDRLVDIVDSKSCLLWGIGDTSTKEK
jgi:chromosome partitioning protein